MKTLEQLLAKLSELEAKAEKNADDNAQIESYKNDIKQLQTQADENARQAAIYAVCDELDVGADIRKEYIGDTKKDADGLKAQLYKEMKDASNQNFPLAKPEDTKNVFKDNIQQAMYLKAGLEIKDATESAVTYSGASLIDIARGYLELKGESTLGKSAMQIAQASMSTDDLPVLLLETGRRALIAEMDAYPTSYALITQNKVVSDLKIGKDVRIGGFGLLTPHNEGGKPRKKEVSEEFEQYAIEIYTAEIVFTLEMMINDDLGGLLQAMRDAGQAAERTTDALNYDLLTGGARVKDLSDYTMNDGLPIFHADHGNLTNSALSSTSLSAARKLMAAQTLIDGTTAYITPSTIIVGEELRETAEQLIMSTASLEDNKNNGVVNVHYNKLNIVVSPLITDDSWYLTASMRGIKNLELQGTGGRPTITQIQGSKLSTKYEIIHYAGTYASDYRGLFKGK